MLQALAQGVNACRTQTLEVFDGEGRLSSDGIPHARLSKTTRFADAAFQQEPLLSGISSGMKSGITTDAVFPHSHALKLLLVPTKISMLLILAGVIISLQVSQV